MKKALMAFFIAMGIILFPVSAKAATLQETLVLWQTVQTQATALQNAAAQFDGIILTDPNQIAALDATRQQATLYQQQADVLYQQVQTLYAEQLQQQALAATPITTATQTVTATQTSRATGLVWLSATGSKYHSIPNCSGMNPARARQVTLQEALAKGMTQCKDCW